jgi:hypothetical protein
MDMRTVGEMTPSEFKKLLESIVEDTVEQKLFELLGDPDEGLEIRKSIQERLLRQREAVAAGRTGRSIEEVSQDLGLE